MAEIIQTFLHFNGFLYDKHSGRIGNRTYWRCRKMDECDARVVTTGNAENLAIVKGGNPEDHLHAPNIEEVNALKVVRSVKRRAEEHPEAPPAQILRTELSKVPTGTTYFNNK